MQIFAFPAVRAAPAREEETAVTNASRVGSCKTLIAFDVASRLRLGFAGSNVRHLFEAILH